MKKLSFVFTICCLLCTQLTKLNAQITFVNATTANITPSSAVATGASSPSDKWWYRFGVTSGTLDGNDIEWLKSNGKAPDISMVVPGILNSAKAYNIYLYYVSPSTQNWWVMAKLEDESNFTTYNRSTSGAIQINDNNGNLNHNRLYRVKIGTVTGKTYLRVDFTDGFTAGDNVQRIVFDGVGYEEATPTIFRSKGSGNWNDTNTWQITYDNTTWFDATVAPTASATSVSVMNGHIVTVSVNTTIVGSLVINPGGQLTLNSGTKFGITGNIAINSDASNGTGTLVDANPNGGLTVSGTTNVYQYISSPQTGVNGRNWYISSPLSAASTSVITTATGNGLVYFNGSTWVDEGSTMEVMKGYIAKSPAQNTTINFNGGSLNTGAQSVVNLPLGFNLVGNPYPSYVDFSQATKTNVTNSIWYRSKKDGTYNFHTYNVAGGISVKDGTAIIPPMQSFWIKTTSATNTLGFSNTMRSHQDQSVLGNRLKTPKSVSQKLLRLQVSNGTNSDETVIYFNPNAKDSFDDFDSQKMFNYIDDMPEIYTKIGTEKLVINGYTDVNNFLEIILGLTYKLEGELTIKLTELSNFDSKTKVFLHDKLLNNEIELLPETEYSFNTPAITNNENRFNLLFKSQGVSTGHANANSLNAQVFVNENNQIEIITPEKATFFIYSTLGQEILKGFTNSNRTVVNTITQSGVFVVMVSENGRSYSTRVILNRK